MLQAPSPDKFCEMAQAAFGRTWQAVLAAKTKASRWTIIRCGKGEAPISQEALAALATALQAQIKRNEKMLSDLGVKPPAEPKKPPKLTKEEAGVLAVLVASANKRPAIYDLAPFDNNPEIFIPLEATDYGIGRGGGNRDPEEQDAWLAALVEKGYLQKHPEHRLWRIGPNFPKPTAPAAT